MSNIHIPNFITIHEKGFDGKAIRTHTNSFFGRIWIWIRSGIWLSQDEFKNKLAAAILDKMIQNSSSENSLKEKALQQLLHDEKESTTKIHQLFQNMLQDEITIGQVVGNLYLEHINQNSKDKWEIRDLQKLLLNIQGDEKLQEVAIKFITRQWDQYYRWNRQEETLKFIDIFQKCSFLPKAILKQMTHRKERLMGESDPKVEEEPLSIQLERNRLREQARQEDHVEIKKAAKEGNQLIQSFLKWRGKTPLWNEFSKLMTAANRIILKLEHSNNLKEREISLNLRELILGIMDDSIDHAIEAIKHSPIEKCHRLPELVFFENIVSRNFPLNNLSKLTEAFSEKVLNGPSSNNAEDLAARLSFAKKYSNYITPQAKVELEKARETFVKTKMGPYEKWNSEVTVVENEVLQMLNSGISLADPTFRQKLQHLRASILQFDPPEFIPSILLDVNHVNLSPEWAQFRMEGKKSLNIKGLKAQEEQQEKIIFKCLQNADHLKKVEALQRAKNDQQAAMNDLRFMFDREAHEPVDDLISDAALAAVEKSVKRNEKRVAELQEKQSLSLPSDSELEEMERRVKILEPNYKNELEILESKLQIEIYEITEKMKPLSSIFEFNELKEAESEMKIKQMELIEIRRKIAEVNADQRSEKEKEIEANALRQVLEQIRLVRQEKLDSTLEKAINRLNSRRDLHDLLFSLKQIVDESKIRMTTIIEELSSPVQDLLVQAVKVGDLVIETDLREYGRGMDVGPALATYIEKGDSQPAIQFYTNYLYNHFKDAFPFEFLQALRQTLESGVREKLGVITHPLSPMDSPYASLSESED